MAAALVAVALVAGCGDDDEPETATETATQSEPATGTTERTETTEPDAGGTPPDKAALASCLAEAKLELKAADEPFTDSEGKTKTREDLDIDAATYLGYVQWPSKAVADVYVGDDEAAAEEAEQVAGKFVQAFGFEPSDYVRRAGTVVMTFDDPPPSDEEAKQVEACAAGG